MPKIYTKSGDQGQTTLGDGQRVSKSSLRIEVLGLIDELSATLGLVYTSKFNIKKIITSIQTDLMNIGAVISLYKNQTDLQARISNLENQIDELEKKLPELKNFILPGGHPTSAFLHLGRTVCRRSERAAVKLLKSESHQSKNLQEVISYLNRLSDFLFVLARGVEFMV